MKLKKDSYVISRATLEKVMSALAAHHTFVLGSCGDQAGEEDNNDDVIKADEALSKEVEAQNIRP